MMASDVSPVALFYNEKRGPEKLIFSAFPISANKLLQSIGYLKLFTSPTMMVGCLTISRAADDGSR